MIFAPFETDSEKNTIMTKTPLRIGLVGANPNQSWAKLSHIPAIQALPEVELVAVATSNDKSAREAGEAFGVSQFYGNADELAQGCGSRVGCR